VVDSVLRTDCLVGAVQDWFWDASGADRALRFCALISEASQKGVCYLTLIIRAASIYPDPQAVAEFCAKVEADYRRSCPLA